MDDPGCQLQLTRLAGDFHALALELGELGVEIVDAPAQMIDRVSHAWRRFALLREHPHITVLDRLQAAFQLRPLTAELLLIPGQNRVGVGTSEVDVMKTWRLGILNDFDLDAPG